uniref:Uncharacterized protein n=1 Tax=Tanacetum cinerariifolium TaxID=118510 RepID=A0A6L2M8A4_TANCI|nr:hypothetical protein [Tanacetum cinerariifolium]
MGYVDEQPDVEAAPKHDWFKKPTRPPTPDPEWIQSKSTWLNDLANEENLPLTYNDLMSTPIDFSTFAMNRLKISKLRKADLVAPVYNLLKETCKSCVELEYNMEECYCDLYDHPEGNRYPYDLSEPLPLQESQGRLTEIVMRRSDKKLYKFMEGDFSQLHLNDIEDMLLLIAQNKLNNLDGYVIFHLAMGLHMHTRRIVIQSRVEDLQLRVEKPQRVICEDKLKRKKLMCTEELYNNDLENLRGGSTDTKYTTSITKTKAIKYDVEGIDDMVPNLWSPIKSETSVTVDEWYGYGHLKEIVVRRADLKFYKFMEGEFPWLHLNNIKDVFLLIAQNKLNNLDGNFIVHLAVGLRMYTRRIVIQSRVKDLQLGDDTLALDRNTLDQMLKNIRLGYNKAMKRRN